jgi:hypothetical protein
LKFEQLSHANNFLGYYYAIIFFCLERAQTCFFSFRYDTLIFLFFNKIRLFFQNRISTSASTFFLQTSFLTSPSSSFVDPRNVLTTRLIDAKFVPYYQTSEDDIADRTDLAQTPSNKNVWEDQTILSSYNMKIRFFIFKLFFLFSYSFTNTSFMGNSGFIYYNVRSYGERLLVVNYRNFFSRWFVSYDFLTNLTYFQVDKLLLTSPFFKQESLAVNWNIVSWEVELWKYFSNFFLSQTPTYDQKVGYFFSRLYDRDVTFAVVSDCSYHRKNIFFLKKNHYLTAGLLTLNDDPLLLDYPILSFYDNFLVQSLFLKFLIFIEKQTLFYKYGLLKKLWYQSKFFYLN